MTEKNGVYFDRPEQLAKIEPLIIDGETLHAVLDCKGGGTGYIAVTSRRLIFQDANWRKSKNVLVSVPWDRIHAVAIGAEYGFFRSTATIAIQAGDDDWLFEFKNAEKVRDAYQAMMQFILTRETNTPDTAIPAVTV